MSPVKQYSQQQSQQTETVKGWAKGFKSHCSTNKLLWLLSLCNSELLPKTCLLSILWERSGLKYILDTGDNGSTLKFLFATAKSSSVMWFDDRLISNHLGWFPTALLIFLHSVSSIQGLQSRYCSHKEHNALTSDSSSDSGKPETIVFLKLQLISHCLRNDFWNAWNSRIVR